MINRDKLQHILEYAKQQRHIGMHCKVPPEDMVEIVEAAMLQGAAGNSPAIPDRWIPVSERMPKKGQKVFYYFDIVGVHAGYYDGDNTFVNENGGGWLTGDVTHWMEWNMPAAPNREVK
ncbi:DUF551 domain-containing protein [Enterobacter hormaechei]